jgi:hypothetical protein
MVDWRVLAVLTPHISPALLKLLTSIGQVILFSGRKEEDRRVRKGKRTKARSEDVMQGQGSDFTCLVENT